VRELHTDRDERERLLSIINDNIIKHVADCHYCSTNVRVELVTREQMAFVLDVLTDEKWLRDPQEPTLDEIREKVEAMHIEQAGVYLRGEHTRRKSSTEVLGNVLALLEPKKPEPTFKPGDWVVGNPGSVFIFPRAPSPSNYPLVVLVTDLRENRRVGIAWGSAHGETSEDDLRHATPAEIARARGEA
jgi:hypothetical protein